MKNSFIALGTLFLLVFSFTQVKAHYLDSEAESMMGTTTYAHGLLIGEMDAEVFWMQNTQAINCFGSNSQIDPNGGGGAALLITPPLSKEYKYDDKLCYQKLGIFGDNYEDTIDFLNGKIATDPRSDYFTGVRDGFILRICALGLKHYVHVPCSE